MRVRIEDVHNSHGTTFELVFEPENDSDKKPYEFLKSLVEILVKCQKVALYSYKAVSEKDKISIGFAEQTKMLAKLNHHWNSHREDQKYVVLMVEGDTGNYQWGSDDPCLHFDCHWCHEEAWGIKRTAIEVYDVASEGMKLVSVHDECQKKREKQIASIPFAEMA
jgi:anion-transporting  ArsA/GET3 family ATPase